MVVIRVRWRIFKYRGHRHKLMSSKRVKIDISILVSRLIVVSTNIDMVNNPEWDMFSVVECAYTAFLLSFV